jgi:excinuclease ABC subunit C
MSHGNGEILPTLRAEMERASSAEEYERATKIRDQIQALEKAQESTDAALPQNLSADFIALHQEGALAAGTLFIVRGGVIKGSRSWIVDQERALEGDDQIGSLLFSIYNESDSREIPAEILISDLPSDQSALEQWLFTIRQGSVSLKIPQRGEKVELLSTVKRNAQYALIQYLSKRANDAAVSGKALTEIEELLDLERTPLRIECFDISNISGTSVVASMVVFEDGLAKKSEYRRFIIDTSEGFDDTRAMHQVITRRLKRLLDDREVDQNEVAQLGGRLSKFSYPPQLIVVDGGAPQVSAAARAMRELGVTDIALCGLAKRLEEVWVPDSKDPLILPRTSEGLYLLQRIRDEAHRFAITFHRSRRSKVMLESLLDEIPGLGATRRKALLEKFGSVAGIRKADASEISQIPGIGEKIASQIAHHLSQVGTSSVDMETGEISSN